MAFPTKGSSLIHVDGVYYRWRIRQKPTYDQAAYGTAVTVSIQLDNEPNCVLLVYSDSPRPDNWHEFESRSITPCDVESYIREALLNGWQPSEPGSAFKLRKNTT